MPDSEPQEQTLGSAARERKGRIGDVPEAIGRRYYTDDRYGPGRGYYVDSTVRRPAFRDRGHVLATERADPNAIRDMTEIAKHRGWSIVTVRGSAEFRREAWLAGRQAGLDVRGYQPTERDLQDLERRLERRARGEHRRDLHAARNDLRDDVRSRGQDRRGEGQMRAIEAVVRAHVQDDDGRQRIIDRARARIADWLERGAQFEPPRERLTHSERQRSR